MEKELRSHNKRISSQEKVNEKQEKNILSIQERTSGNKRETKEDVTNSYTFLIKESVPKNLQDDVLRIKRQASSKLAQSNIAKFFPYPDNPDIYYRKGILYSIALMG